MWYLHDVKGKIFDTPRYISMREQGLNWKGWNIRDADSIHGIGNEAEGAGRPE